MKNSILIPFGIILPSLFISSCHDTNEKGDIPTIDFEKMISKKPFDDLVTSNWDIWIMTPELTDSTVLENPFVKAITDEHTYMMVDQSNMFTFSEDGKCIEILNRRGQGPGEYLYMTDMSLLADGSIAIYDIERSKYLIYDSDRVYQKTLPMPLSSMNNWDGGVLALSFATDNKIGTRAYWMSANFDVLDSLVVDSPREINKGFVFMPSINDVNGKPTILVNDTIFDLSKIGEKIPVMAFNRGNLKLPPEIEDDYSRLTERDNYMWNFYSIIWNEYAFVFYYHKERTYYDIWDYENDKLVFRSIDEYGFPLQLPEGTVRRVWPKTVIDGNLIGNINPEFQNDSSKQIESNPSIFVISRIP